MAPLLEHAKSLGQEAIAITDHGVMYGVIEFYKQAKKAGIKPVLGCEVYTAPRTRHDKTNELDSSQGHLVLLAENMTGYKNLMHIVSLGFLEGFYYKPRIDFEVLEQYHDGIIALGACLAGDVPRAILNGNEAEAERIALRYLEIFGEGNFFLEMQDHGIPEQKTVNAALIRISQKTGIPLVVTNDVHYVKREDATHQDVLMCIQTGKKVKDTDRMKFSTEDFYLKSGEEMSKLFPHHAEALQNTIEIAKRCEVELAFHELHLPQFDVPAHNTPFEYLKGLCTAGLHHRYKQVDKTLTYRLEYELEVIRSMGFVDYFLIVWDFIRFAKENNIAVGPGRGSAAGSLVAFTLGITNVDPLRFALLFERFLNPERISMPDIDIDFCYERRQEVIDYVVEKYGKDCVAQIITFGTMAARAAIRDVGRVLDIPYGDVDVIAKKVPMALGMNLDLALKISPDLLEMYEGDETVQQLIDVAKALEGMPRHASTHAAGVVISKEPLDRYVPLQKNDEVVTTQFPMTTLEELGLLKMDFLGLRTLTVIRDTVDAVAQTKGIHIEMETLPFDHPEVFQLLCQGNTDGVFQLESAGMKQFMRELKPNSLEDIIAGISLYRPGPMDQIPRYIENKNHPESISFLHPMLKDILDVTYGCIVYQEQVMQIVRELGGYSLGRADLLRRAMSKKKADVMETEAKNFVYGVKDEVGNVVVDGCIARGVSEEIGVAIFNEMIDFAKYAFNKSHAAAYAVVAYHTAYLKAFYPTEFMAAMLNSSDKIPQYIAECKKMNIKVLPPDVNESNEKFTPLGETIRFGLVAVKNVGLKMVQMLVVERRRNGSFTSFEDFLERMHDKEMNKRAVESLIKAGAMDCFPLKRSQMMASYEGILNGFAQQKKNQVEGQISLFGLEVPMEQSFTPKIQYPDIKEFQQKELLLMEKEMLGLYLTGHPLEEVEEQVKKFVNTSVGEITEAHELLKSGDIPLIGDGTRVTVAGVVVSLKKKFTKNDTQMAFITLEDMTSQMEIIVFPKKYTQYHALLTEDSVIIVTGRLSMSEDEEPKILLDDVQRVEKETQQLKLYLRMDLTNEILVKKVKEQLAMTPGNTPVLLYDEKTKALQKAPRTLWVTANEACKANLGTVLGAGNVKMVWG